MALVEPGSAAHHRRCQAGAANALWRGDADAADCLRQCRRPAPGVQFAAPCGICIARSRSAPAVRPFSRQLLVEAVTLSLCGGAAGVVLAYGLVHASVRLMPLDIPRMGEASIDANVLLFDLGMSLLFTGLALRSHCRRCATVQAGACAGALRDGSRGIAGERGRSRIHNGLVIAQTAIGVVLLIGSGLLIRSFLRILNVDPGFEPKHLLTSRIWPCRLKSSTTTSAFFSINNLLQTPLPQVPGVESASAGWPLPMSKQRPPIFQFNIQGQPDCERETSRVSTWAWLCPATLKPCTFHWSPVAPSGDQDGAQGTANHPRESSLRTTNTLR